MSRLHRGQIHQAKEMWKAARPLFGQSSRTNDVAAINAKLAELARSGLDMNGTIAGNRVLGQTDPRFIVGIPTDRVMSYESAAEELASELQLTEASTSQPGLGLREGEAKAKVTENSASF
jgi:hypothetical protein